MAPLSMQKVHDFKGGFSIKNNATNIFFALPPDPSEMLKWMFAVSPVSRSKGNAELKILSPLFGRNF